MNDESIFSQPFDENLVKAITSPDSKDWYKYRLGVDAPSLGEVMDMPGARTGRFDRADAERVQLFHLYQQHLEKQKIEQLKPLLSSLISPGSPGSPAIQATPGNVDQTMEQIRQPLMNQGVTEPLIQAGAGGIQPPSDLQANYQPNPVTNLTMPTPGAPAIPPTPFMAGNREITDPNEQAQWQRLAKTGMRIPDAQALALMTSDKLVKPEQVSQFIKSLESGTAGPGIAAPVANEILKLNAAKEQSRSPFGKAIDDYKKLPDGPLKSMMFNKLQQESAQIVGTPEYNANLKVMGVLPGHETPEQALKALNAVDTRKYANERFLQALKAGDETMNIIAARIGKEKGMKQATFSDLSVADQAKATDEWMNKKGYLASIQGAGSAAAHENVKRVAALAPAQVIMDALDKQIGTLFTAGGSLDRAIQTPGINLGTWTQTNKDAVLYQSLSQGFLAKLARAAGEVGVLTEQDVARAEKLLPRLLPVPDTKEVAAGKMKQLREMLDEISSRQVSVEGLPTMGAKITHKETSKQKDMRKMSDDELLKVLQGK